MSKERLEEIQKEVNYAYRRDGSISTKAVTMPIEHYEHLYEQAERVRELEETNKKNYWIAADFKFENLQLEQQNKRYREALEEIKKEETVTTALSEGQVAYTISGHIARKALEREG